MTILKFITMPENIERLKEGLKHIVVLEFDKDGKLSTDPSLFNKSHASLSRDTGAGILEMIASATKENPVPICNDFDFITNEVLCEWAWVVDLDKEVLEAFHHNCSNYVGRFNGEGSDKLGLLRTFSFTTLQDVISSFVVDFGVYDSEEGETEEEPLTPKGDNEGGSA